MARTSRQWCHSQICTSVGIAAHRGEQDQHRAPCRGGRHCRWRVRRDACPQARTEVLAWEVPADADGPICCRSLAHKLRIVPGTRFPGDGGELSNREPSLHGVRDIGAALDSARRRTQKPPRGLVRNSELERHAPKEELAVHLHLPAPHAGPRPGSERPVQSPSASRAVPLKRWPRGRRSRIASRADVAAKRQIASLAQRGPKPLARASGRSRA
jgi:hypothetical protein